MNVQMERSYFLGDQDVTECGDFKNNKGSCYQSCERESTDAAIFPRLLQSTPNTCVVRFGRGGMHHADSIFIA